MRCGWSRWRSVFKPVETKKNGTSASIMINRIFFSKPCAKLIGSGNQSTLRRFGTIAPVRKHPSKKWIPICWVTYPAAHAIQTTKASWRLRPFRNQRCVRAYSMNGLMTVTMMTRKAIDSPSVRKTR